jgi:hypothetical protein
VLKRILRLNRPKTFQEVQNTPAIAEANSFNANDWLHFVGGKEPERAFLRQFLRVAVMAGGNSISDRENFYNEALQDMKDDPWIQKALYYLAVNDESWRYLVQAIESYRAYDSALANQNNREES